MNTNIDNYTINDLLRILNIQSDVPSHYQIKDESNKLISRLISENKQELVTFMKKARDKLLNSLQVNEDEEEEYDEDYDDDEDGTVRDVQQDENTQQGNWWKNQYPAQKNNEVESSKPTDRRQKVDIFDKEGKQNNAFVMKRERLGILQSHPIPVVQGTINPNLKNIIRRIISIDSQYRSNIIPTTESGFNNVNSAAFNTDFSFDLSERLSNVISMKLNSIQIPTSWYIFDDSLGNTCFKYIDLSSGGLGEIFIKLPSGNYSLIFLNNYFANYTYIIDGISYTVNLYLAITIDEVTGKLIFCSSKPDITLVFYDTRFFNSCLDSSCGSSQMRLNQNFGWNMGYRTILENRLEVSLNYFSGMTQPLPTHQQPPPKDIPAGFIYYNIAQSPANFYGSTYFLLVVDDYNNNRVNNSLVTITNVSNKLDLPSYYSPAIKNANNTFATVGCTDVLNTIDPALKVPPSTIPYMVKSSPRQLTQSQLYTANEILYNRTTFNNKTFGPSTADVLALIPLNNIGNLRNKVFYDITGTDINLSIENRQTSQPYVVFGPTLDANERTYFGPVDIEHMRVRLLDDKGNLVNLNDVDWSFSLIIEQLYQY
jgi:hypothetical protein